MMLYIDGLEQERRNSSALAMELCLSCTKPIDINWWSFQELSNAEHSISYITITTSHLAYYLQQYKIH